MSPSTEPPSSLPPASFWTHIGSTARTRGATTENSDASQWAELNGEFMRSPTPCAARAHDRFQRERQTGANRGDTMKRCRLDPDKPRELTPEEERRLAKSRIDYSDIPPLGDEFFAQAKRAWPPTKQQLTVRLDTDVLAWLKQSGRGYQNSHQLDFAGGHGRPRPSPRLPGAYVQEDAGPRVTLTTAAQTLAARAPAKRVSPLIRQSRIPAPGGRAHIGCRAGRTAIPCRDSDW